VFSCNANVNAVSAERPGETREKARQKVERASTQSNMDTRQGLRRCSGRNASARGARLLGALGLALLATGCSELQARHHAREGNSKYLEGDYAGAVREYEAAEQKYPDLAVVADSLITGSLIAPSPSGRVRRR